MISNTAIYVLDKKTSCIKATGVKATSQYKIMSENILYWVTNDLRVKDNRILHAAKHAKSLTCVYVIDPETLQSNLWMHPGMSQQRRRFLHESLIQLDRDLSLLGQKLIVMHGSVTTSITQLIDAHDIDRLLISRRCGTYEHTQLRDIQHLRTPARIDIVDQYTLFTPEQLPFVVQNLPAGYTSFRKKVESLDISEPLATPTKLPPPPPTIQAISLSVAEQLALIPNWRPEQSIPIQNLAAYEDSKDSLFSGGEEAANRHLDRYFSSSFPAKYKALRNDLTGWFHSGKFSPWLNLGCISPRQLIQRVKAYEAINGSNDSTHWLFVELLWREYFQWLHHKIGPRLYQFQGLAKHPPLTSFYPERFRKWCEGTTPYPLVNACMKELKTTGFLSNRGRQIVASCLVNELAVDWRYGAAWFQHVLLDYDPATNWGNWQYIAGVGVDPRGGRHFNLDKQTELFDGDGSYRKQWQAEAHATLDSVDAADWPISPS